MLWFLPWAVTCQSDVWRYHLLHQVYGENWAYIWRHAGGILNIDGRYWIQRTGIKRGLAGNAELQVVGPGYLLKPWNEKTKGDCPMGSKEGLLEPPEVPWPVSQEHRQRSLWRRSMKPIRVGRKTRRGHWLPCPDLKKGGGSSLPGPDEIVRTEKCLLCSVTTHPWCLWEEQFQKIHMAWSLESIWLRCKWALRKQTSFKEFG